MRRTMTLRRAGVAVALPLALALTACGAEDDKPSAGKEDASSVSETPAGDNAETDEAAQDEATSSPESGDSSAPKVGGVAEGETLTPAEFTKILQAAFDKATTAEVTLDTTAGDMKTTGEGVLDLSGDTTSMQVSMSSSAVGADQKIDVRLVDDAMYMDMGALSGGKFIKMDLANAQASGLNLSQVDPSKTVEQFEKAATDVTYRGVEKVGGESLHHYELTLDPKKMGMKGAQDKKFPQSVDYDVWFDDGGFVRRLVMGLGEMGSTEVTYTDWGKDVEISAPPASDVMEMPNQPQSPQG